MRQVGHHRGPRRFWPCKHRIKKVAHAISQSRSTYILLSCMPVQRDRQKKRNKRKRDHQICKRTTPGNDSSRTAGRRRDAVTRSGRLKTVGYGESASIAHDAFWLLSRRKEKKDGTIQSPLFLFFSCCSTGNCEAARRPFFLSVLCHFGCTDRLTPFDWLALAGRRA